MKIALCHSMQFAEKADEVKKWFEQNGHKAFPSSFNQKYIGLNDEEKEELKLHHKYNHDAIKEHWSIIQNSDAVLVLNYTKNGIENYIGGNTLLEMGFAYILEKPIYLLNQIPNIPFYETEIKAMKPKILNGELSKIMV